MNSIPFKIDVLFSTNVLHILLIIETSTVYIKYMTAFKVKGKEQKAGKVFFNRNYVLPRGEE